MYLVTHSTTSNDLKVSYEYCEARRYNVINGTEIPAIHYPSVAAPTKSNSHTGDED
jgi:hypothetical protein